MKHVRPQKMSLDPEYYFKKIESNNKKSMDNKPYKYIIQTDKQDGQSTLTIQEPLSVSKPVKTYKKRGPKRNTGTEKPRSVMSRTTEPVYVTFS